MNTLKLIAPFVLLLFSFTGKAQDFSKYDSGSFTKGKDSISYRILFPENFHAEKKYPILFFLHGRGESGQDNKKQLSHGGKLFLTDNVRRQFPAIIVFPQCPSTSYWANVNIQTDTKGKRSFNFIQGGKPTVAMRALTGMIDNLLDKPYVDRKRVYIGGLSMGGMGTYELLRRKPRTFAAAFAICGGDHVANVRKYKKVPLWIFHGERDDVVASEYSVLVANQLRVLGQNPKLTLYPEANHNSWDAAFAEPQLLPWLFSNYKK